MAEKDSLSSQLMIPAPVDGDRYKPFPLTDVQQAYWLGRRQLFDLGGVSTHLYFETNCVGLDLQRFNDSLNVLIKHHDSLRTIFTQDGLQQVLAQIPPYEIQTYDLRGANERQVAAHFSSVRAEMSAQVLPADRAPMFDIRASLLDQDHIELHFSFDALIMDAWSRRLLFAEWHKLYLTPETKLAPLNFTFREFVLSELATRESPEYKKALDFWWQRLDDLPPVPAFQIVPPTERAHQKTVFTQREHRIPTDVWQRIKQIAATYRLTASNTLLTAYSEVIRRWSTNDDFLLNVTVFNRGAHHAQIDQVLGDFTTLALLEIESDGLTNFVQRAQANQERMFTNLSYSQVSAITVLREYMRRNSLPPGAHAPVVFTSQLGLSSEQASTSPFAWLGQEVFSVRQTPQVWLDLIVLEEAGELIIKWNSVEDLFLPGTMESAFNAYCAFLDQLAEDSDWTAYSLQVPLPAQQLAQIEENNSQHAPVSPALLHTLFESQAAKFPTQVALISSNRTMTYQELEQEANQLGQQLRSLGAKPNTLIAIVMEKGWEQVVAALAILKAGAAYLPIDANLPKERLWHLLAHGEVELVLTQPEAHEKINWPETVQPLVVGAIDFEDGLDTSLNPIQNSLDIAYVIYTSGSTGLPKGVVIDHRGAVNTLLDLNKRFEIGPHDRVLGLSALTFDLSVYDIFGILGAGGTLVLPAPADLRDPARWAALVKQHQVTLWNTVPAFERLYVEYLADHPEMVSDSLRLVWLSGDWIPVNLPAQIRQLNPGAQVISMGGATEASIWSIIYPIGEVEAGWPSIPYGKAMVNQEFYVFDHNLAHRPIGVIGELYIGGLGLAQGYWRDEEKTRASFIVHPVTGRRLYRTGDLGRYLPDGNIEFIGRNDSQVKIQGFRVELGEIESALLQHEAIKEAAAVLWTDPQGEGVLAAYVVPAATQPPAVEAWRVFLQNKLPAYMVPTHLMTLAALPLSANGKVDRNALPRPTESDQATRTPSSTQQNEHHIRIGHLIKEVIGREITDMDADLINLGATSVDMIRIVNLLDRELGFRPDINKFYRQASIAALVEMYRADSAPTSKTTELPQVKVASSPVLDDPAARAQFKERGLNLRKASRAAIALPPPAIDATLAQVFEQRRSYRHFSLKPITQVQLSSFLAALSASESDGKLKYQYASAGGLYPVQTYLFIKPGRVTGLAPGVYYYQPLAHQLLQVSELQVLDPEIYGPFINRPIYHEAAFAIFLIGQLQGIAPLYGDRSQHYATLEAGIMAHHLESVAPSYELGLCQIGSFKFDEIRAHFDLDTSHILLHSMLGGLIDARADADQPAIGPGDQSAARLLARIKNLSPEEVAALLEAEQADE